MFCDHPNLTWEYVSIVHSRPVTGITEGPQNAVTANLPKFIQAAMAFHYCLSLYCLIDQLISSRRR